MNMKRETTPGEKSRELMEALRFCREKGLITPEEIGQARSRQEKFRLACRALLRKELWERQHMSREDKEILEALEDESRTIWRRPKMS